MTIGRWALERVKQVVRELDATGVSPDSVEVAVLPKSRVSELLVRTGEREPDGQFSDDFLATLPDLFTIEDVEDAICAWRREHKGERDLGMRAMYATLPRLWRAQE